MLFSFSLVRFPHRPIINYFFLCHHAHHINKNCPGNKRNHIAHFGKQNPVLVHQPCCSIKICAGINAMSKTIVM